MKELPRLFRTRLIVVLLIPVIGRIPLIAGGGTYTTRYDNVDVDAVIKNERLTNNYVGCLLGSKSCTPDAGELKKNLPDALATDCARCSETQKRVADKFSRYLIDHRPEDWKLLEAMYDPTGAYRTRYLAEVQSTTVSDTEARSNTNAEDEA